MTITKTNYTVELTTREAELIMEALHNMYMQKSNEWDDDTKSRTGDKGYELVKELRTLRNAFCDITKTYYMGKDA